MNIKDYTREEFMEILERNNWTWCKEEFKTPCPCCVGLEENECIENCKECWLKAIENVKFKGEERTKEEKPSLEDRVKQLNKRVTLLENIIFSNLIEAPTRKQMKVISFIEDNIGIEFTGGTKEEARDFIKENMKKSKEARQVKEDDDFEKEE